MGMDGHRALENKKVNEASAGHFNLVLSILIDNDDTATFVIHATSNFGIGSSFGPLEFLQRIGYRHFNGDCQFHHARCFWLPLAQVEREPFIGNRQVESAHGLFKEHSQQLPGLYEHFTAIYRKLCIPESGNIDLFPELVRKRLLKNFFGVSSQRENAEEFGIIVVDFHCLSLPLDEISIL